MIRPKVTILTDPMPWGRHTLHESTRRIVRWVWSTIHTNRKYYEHPQYRGHFAVTRSLVEGLIKIKANFNYNPLCPIQMAHTVIVLAGIGTLRQAIRLKKRGWIKKLYAGPNIVVFSSDEGSILASPEIDYVITPCDWVIDVYVEDNKSLMGRCFAWPAGVDTDYWRPSLVTNRDRILIFDKQNKGPVGPVAPYADYLRELGWEVEIIEYGTFTHDQFLQMLQRSCLMLGFVTDESQGIAWAEAWSTDVPTLLWKNTTNVYRGRLYHCSTAPYLRPQNGLFFTDFEDFKIQFDYWVAHKDQFTPRAWTLKHMSDEVCSSILYEKIIE